MKKVFKSALVIAVGALLALSSCKKADEATPVESLGSGTVQGQIFYDNNELNDEDGSAFIDTDAPTGAIIRYTYTDVITNETVIGTTTVDGSGNYSFEVPTNEDGVEVVIEIDDFDGNFTFDYYDEDGDDRETTESGYYEGFEISDDTFVTPGKKINIPKEILEDFVSTANPAEENDNVTNNAIAR